MALSPLSDPGNTQPQSYEPQALTGTANLILQALNNLVVQIGELVSTVATQQVSGANAVVPFAYITTSQTAASGQWLSVGTTGGAVTVTLPSSPTVNNYVVFMDADGTFATNNLTIDRNGETINGSASNLTLSTNGQFLGLVYTGATPSWRTFLS